MNRSTNASNQVPGGTRLGEDRFLGTDGAGATHSIWTDKVSNRMQRRNTEDDQQLRNEEKERMRAIRNYAHETTDE